MPLCNFEIEFPLRFLYFSPNGDKLCGTDNEKYKSFYLFDVNCKSHKGGILILKEIITD